MDVVVLNCWVTDTKDTLYSSNSSTSFALLFFLLRLLLSPFRPISRLEAENAALRRQLIVLQRQVRGRVQFTNSDRLFFLQLYRWFPSIVEAMTTIRPAANCGVDD
jgi:hypothetical protein